MTGYKLLENYIKNLEALLWKKRSCAASSATPTTVEPVNPTPSATPSMAKTLRDYSTPIVANMLIGPTVNIGEGNFELCASLIMMVQANHEDTNAHLQHFLELCDTIVIKDVAPESIWLRLFPFCLSGKAK